MEKYIPYVLGNILGMPSVASTFLKMNEACTRRLGRLKFFGQKLKCVGTMTQNATRSASNKVTTANRITGKVVGTIVSSVAGKSAGNVIHKTTQNINSAIDGIVNIVAPKQSEDQNESESSEEESKDNKTDSPQTTDTLLINSESNVPSKTTTDATPISTDPRYMIEEKTTNLISEECKSQNSLAPIGGAVKHIVSGVASGVTSNLLGNRKRHGMFKIRTGKTTSLSNLDE